MPAFLSKRLSHDSVDGQIARAALISGGLTLLVKSLSFAKEILVAAVFGVTLELDVYLIALMLIGLPHGIVVNAVQWTMIPEFVRLGPASTQARILLRRSVSLSLLLLAALLVLWVALLPWLQPLLTSNLGPDSAERIRQCFLLLCVYYFTSGTLLLGYAALQARRRFVANGMIPLATPIISAVVILIWNQPVAEALALGMVLGFLTELFFVERLLRAEGLTLLPAWPAQLSRGLGHPYLSSVARLAVGGIAMALMPLVEQYSAVQLGVGAVSTLGFANKLPAVVSSLSVVAIGVAVFPYFADMIARNDLAGCRRTLRFYSLLLMVGGVLAALVLYLLSDIIVRMFFMRGEFSETAALAVSAAQQAYLLQLPAALVLTLSLKMLLSLRRSGWMLLLNLLQLGLYAAAIGVGIQYQRSPTVIALSYSFAVSVTALLAYLLASRTMAAKLED